MRQQLRFLMFCSLAAVAAGCSDSNKDGNGGSNNALSPAAELCGSIGDKVWLDENGNGIQDNNEPGVPGVTVRAEICGGGTAATTSTDANGNYLFANLDDNLTYRLCFVAPPGYAWTTPNQGGVEQTDSDVMADGCLNACVILNDCKAPRYVDAGLRRTDDTFGCASIGDRVWFDTNCNGVQDQAEPGAPGVTVTLETCDGDVVASTVTNASGIYLFDPVDENFDYRVCVDLPDGYSFSPADQGGVEGMDSDVGPNGCSSCIDVGHCKAPRWIDAGLCRSGGEEGCASIGDRVWLDDNCNGIQDGGESGVPGVTVNLETCGGAFVSSTVTNGNGNYLFDNLDDSVDYRVCFVLPAGYSFSPANQGGVEANDSDAGSGGCTNCISLDSCKAPRYIDAGLCREDEVDYESCSPGFWKNHYAAWGPTGYSPNDVFDDVFGCDIFGDDTTLGEAIHIEDTHNVLAFHAVAALLNATHPDLDDFPYTADQVKDLTCDRNKEALSDSVNDNCNLSADNNHGDDDDDDDDHNGDDDDDDDDDDDGGHKDKD